MRACIAAKARDQIGVGPVILGTLQLALAIGFDTRRIDQTHLMTGSVQEPCEGFRITTGGFQTSPDLHDAWFGAPVVQLGKTCVSVGELFVFFLFVRRRTTLKVFLATSMPSMARLIFVVSMFVSS